VVDTVTAATLSVLEELETRAGAPYSNRPAWLAERRGGLTATEVKQLALGGVGAKRKLIEAKLSGIDEPELTAGPVVWGNVREPVIAAEIDARHGIHPEERVFRAADNSRFLASPDGVGVGWDDELLVSEIKTSGGNKTVGSEGFARSGYALQMQWSMRVTGARRCLYVVEERLQGEGGFFPGDRFYAWIDYDESTVRRLEAIAVDFLDALDEERQRRETGEGPVIDEYADTLALNYLKGLDVEKQGVELKKSAYEELRTHLAAGEPFAQKSTLAQITYSPEETETVLVVDEDAARAADVTDIRGDIEHLEAELLAARARWAVHCEPYKTREETRVTKREVLRVTAGKDTRKAKD
jgi:hypothetical protein